MRRGRHRRLRLHRCRHPHRARLQRAHRGEPRRARCCWCSADASVRASGERLGLADARTPGDLQQIAELAIAELRHEHATLLAVVVEPRRPRAARRDRRCSARLHAPGRLAASGRFRKTRSSSRRRMQSIMEATDGALLAGDRALLGARGARRRRRRRCRMENVLPRLIEGCRRGRARRPQRGAARGHARRTPSGTFPSIAGIVLNGGFDPPEPIERLIDGLGATPADHPHRARAPTTPSCAITPHPRPARRRLAAQDRHRARAVRAARRRATPCSTGSTSRSTSVVTPLMFEYDAARAGAARTASTSCCPRATTTASCAPRPPCSRAVSPTSRSSARTFEIRAAGHRAGPRHLARRRCSRPHDHGARRRSSRGEYARLRAHKGMTLEQARDIVTDVVVLRHDDGAHRASPTAWCRAPRTRPRTPSARRSRSSRPRPASTCVSSVFLMALDDRVLVYGDCAVIPDPTARAARRHRDLVGRARRAQFGIEPRVAMLSYSTGESGLGCRRREGARGDGARAGASPGPAGRGSDPVRRRRRRRRGARRRCPSRRWPGERRCSSSPTSTPATTPTRPCSGRPEPSPSGPCCRACASRSTTSRAERSCRTSSTPSRSRRSRRPTRVSTHPRRQLGLVVVQVPAHRHGRRAHVASGLDRADRRGHGASPSRRDVTADGDARRSRARAPIADHAAGFARDARGLRRGRARRSTSTRPIAVGHRVVHGGKRFFEPTDRHRRGEDQHRRPLRARAAAQPRRTSQGIEAAQQSLPRRAARRVFDTAFHQTLPPAAYTYAIDADCRRAVPGAALRIPRHVAQVRVGAGGASSLGGPLARAQPDRRCTSATARRSRRSTAAGRSRPRWG